MKLVFKTIEGVQEYASRLTLTRFDTFTYKEIRFMALEVLAVYTYTREGAK